MKNLSIQKVSRQGGITAAPASIIEQNTAFTFECELILLYIQTIMSEHIINMDSKSTGFTKRVKK